jgi:hypothetical protein
MKPKTPSRWSYWPDPADRAYLRSWLAQIPLVWDTSGQHVSDIAGYASSRTIEACLRDWIYWNFIWTGVQGSGGPFPLPPGNLVNSPIPLLRWTEASGGLKKVTWSCGPLNCVKIGLLAACGISARLCWSSHAATGAVDVISEYWDDEAAQWVLVSTQLNTHWELRGKRLSFYEWCLNDRSGVSMDHPTIAGQGAPLHYPDNFDHWRGMSGNPHVHSGNWNQGAGPDAYDPNTVYLQLMPRIGAAIELGGTAVPCPGSSTSIYGSPAELAAP